MSTHCKLRMCEHSAYRMFTHCKHTMFTQHHVKKTEDWSLDLVNKTESIWKLHVQTVLVWWETQVQPVGCHQRACNELAVSGEDLETWYIFPQWQRLLSAQDCCSKQVFSDVCLSTCRPCFPLTLTYFVFVLDSSESPRMAGSPSHRGWPSLPDVRWIYKNFPLTPRYVKRISIIIIICIIVIISKVCPLEIGSFGHPSSDIIYKWADKPLRSNWSCTILHNYFI